MGFVCCVILLLLLVFFFFFFLFWVEKMNVVTAMVGWVGVLVCLGVEIVIIEREERDGCGDLPFG